MNAKLKSPPLDKTSIGFGLRLDQVTEEKALLIPHTATGVHRWLLLSLLPRTPLSALPQVRKVPFASRAALPSVNPPTATAVEMPQTNTGVAAPPEFVPSPRRPCPGLPQLIKHPFAKRAVACAKPERIAIAFVIVQTATGTEQSLPLVVLPMVPSQLRPQPLIVPSAKTAYFCIESFEIATAVEIPQTLTGVHR